MPDNSVDKLKKAEEDVLLKGVPVVEKKSDLVQATVAPRRSLSDGTKTFGPGAIVEMPVDEIARLRRTGHLLPPDGEIRLATDDGPTVNNEPL